MNVLAYLDDAAPSPPLPGGAPLRTQLHVIVGGASVEARSLDDDLSRLSSAAWTVRDALTRLLSEPVDKDLVEARHASAAAAGAWAFEIEAALRRVDAVMSMPHVTCNALGEIVFEWWRGARKLTLYFEPAEVSYVRVWGPDVDREMEDGILAFAAEVVWLWDWLEE